LNKNSKVWENTSDDFEKYQKNIDELLHYTKDEMMAQALYHSDDILDETKVVKIAGSNHDFIHAKA